MAIRDSGPHLGYDETLYAVTTGVSAGDNLLEFLAGQTLESVCAAVADGKDSLASLFSGATSKRIVTVETLDDLDDEEFEVKGTGRESPPGYFAQTLLRFG